MVDEKDASLPKSRYLTAILKPKREIQTGLNDKGVFNK